MINILKNVSDHLRLDFFFLVKGFEIRFAHLIMTLVVQSFHPCTKCMDVIFRSL